VRSLPRSRGRVGERVSPQRDNPPEEKALSPTLSRRRERELTSELGKQVGTLSPGWRFVSIVVTLRRRGCCARQEPLSPGPYRSFRELSLAGPVGSVIWCPPTFVGNSGIECFNGVCGFALCFLAIRSRRVVFTTNRRCHARPGAQLRTRRVMAAEQVSAFGANAHAQLQVRTPRQSPRQTRRAE